MKISTSRNGFTMIELIFAIVIIGILAAVAIPKLTATKDSADAVAELSDLRTAKTDIVSHVLIDGNLTNLPTNNLECFTLSVSNTKLLTVVNSASNLNYCTKARTDANTSNLYESIQL